jgi:hypothetical protein
VAVRFIAKLLVEKTTDLQVTDKLYHIM